MIHLERRMGMMVLDSSHTVISCGEFRDEFFNQGCFAIFLRSDDKEYFGAWRKRFLPFVLGKIASPSTGDRRFIVPHVSCFRSREQRSYQ